MELSSPDSLQNIIQNISVDLQVQGLVLRHDLPPSSAKFGFFHFEGDLIVEHHHGGLHFLSHLNINILNIIVRTSQSDKPIRWFSPSLLWSCWLSSEICWNFVFSSRWDQVGPSIGAGSLTAPGSLFSLALVRAGQVGESWNIITVIISSPHHLTAYQTGEHSGFRNVPGDAPGEGVSDFGASTFCSLRGEISLTISSAEI